MYKYETHLHTYPVSACAAADVRENLEFYKDAGYDGVFITNHFIDGNINISRSLPYEEKIEFYFTDYEKALEMSEEIGIKVFLGIEMSYGGTDFLIYGLDKKWFLEHPEIAEMKKSDELAYLAENGALVIQAHPFRQAAYIDHIRLFPHRIHGVEVINGCRSDFENHMAKLYSENYGLIDFAGTDNHSAGGQKTFAGMCSDTPVVSEEDFVKRVFDRQMKVFSAKRDELIK